MGDNSRSPSFTPSQTESSLVDPHRAVAQRAPMRPEVLGIFINTCHMLVPRCAARLHMEIWPKKPKERGVMVGRGCREEVAEEDE